MDAAVNETKMISILFLKITHSYFNQGIRHSQQQQVIFQNKLTEHIFVVF